MASSHVDAAEEVFRNAVAAQPSDVAEALSTYATLRCDSVLPRSYQDALGQPYRDAMWLDLPQAYRWTAIHRLVVAGQLGFVSVEIGQTPHQDRERDKNARALAMPPAPFEAQLDLIQRAADCDGTLSWDGALVGFTGDGAGGLREARCPPHAAHLEVGACLPSRVRLHLLQFGSVARWPYKSDRVLVLFGIPHPHAFAVAQKTWKENQLLGDQPLRVAAHYGPVPRAGGGC